MKTFTISAAVALTFAISGCSNSSGRLNTSLESVHQPVVQQSQHRFDVTVYGDDLSPSEASRLSAWLDAIGNRYGDHVIIEDSSHYGQPRAITSVQNILAKRGASTSTFTSDGADSAGSNLLRLTLTRSTATVQDCPNWNSKSSTDFYNRTSSNYGCAVNGNLAAMVADPSDLVRGKGATDNNAQHGARAVKSYRERELTGNGELRKNETSEGGE